MKACWVWEMQGVERHLRGPSTNRQEPSGAPCSLEEDPEPLSQDQRPLERSGRGGGARSQHNHSRRSLSGLYDNYFYDNLLKIVL